MQLGASSFTRWGTEMMVSGKKDPVAHIVGLVVIETVIGRRCHCRVNVGNSVYNPNGQQRQTGCLCLRQEREGSHQVRTGAEGRYFLTFCLMFLLRVCPSTDHSGLLCAAGVLRFSVPHHFLQIISSSIF